MLKYEKESLLTKVYFQSTLQMFMDEKAELPSIGCLNPNTYQGMPVLNKIMIFNTIEERRRNVWGEIKTIYCFNKVMN